MQIQRKGYNIRGFWKISNYAIRLAYMVTDEAQKRAKILSFWKRYGLKATIEAFGVSRRTLFNWKSKLSAHGGKLDGLNDKSKAPKTRRTRLWPIEIIRTIKTLRWEHPNLGKDKLYPLLLEYCESRSLKCPSIATIGRLIADAPDKMRREVSKPSCAGKRSKQKPKKKPRKPKDYEAKEPGECLALDSVEYHKRGQRRYLVTLIDVYSRFAFAYGTNSHASLQTSEKCPDANVS
jgi:transposase-like protein